MRHFLEGGKPVSDIFEAAREAGCQLVVDGRMSPETFKTVSRELLPLEQYIQGVNQWFQQALNAAKGKILTRQQERH